MMILAIRCVLLLSATLSFTLNAPARPRIGHPLFAAGEGFSKKKDPPLSSKSQSAQQPQPPPTQQPTPMASNMNADNNSKMSIDDQSRSDRQDAILREKFGMTKTETTGAKKAVMDAKRALASETTAASKEGFSLSSIPQPLLVFLDKFLKTGLAVTTTAFVAAGLAISLEAATVAFKFQIPQAVDEFIVSTLEPNFTPLLGVLLLFSISLGIFTTIQLTSDEATYKE